MLVLLNANCKIWNYHSLLRKLHFRFHFFIFLLFFSDFTCVILVCYVFNELLSVKVLLPWNPVKLIYCLASLSCLCMLVLQLN